MGAVWPLNAPLAPSSNGSSKCLPAPMPTLGSLSLPWELASWWHWEAWTRPSCRGACFPPWLWGAGSWGPLLFAASPHTDPFSPSPPLADLYEEQRFALNQVINGRLQLGPKEGLPRPYRQKEVHLYPGPQVAPHNVPPECLSLSLNWCGGDEILELVDGTVGKAAQE